LDHGWVEARDLLPGHELFTSRGGWLRVSGATWRAHSATVYKLEVADHHTYFAGDAEAWVHNSCGDPKFPGKDPTKAPDGFEWKGKPGSKPGSKDGSYHNPETGEVLRPDVDHPPPVEPHWDYKDPSKIWWRIYPDGTKEPK
jgi:hypothetical protein